MPLDRLKSNLRRSGAFMALPYGSKARKRRWAESPDASLKTKNIAVIQGTSGNGICSIDLDGSDNVCPEDLLKRFIDLNPLFKWTFRTGAKRGCNLWFQCKGEIPRSFKFKDSSGEACGEFRSSGSYTVVQGKHPDGMAYRAIVDLPAIVLEDLDDVKWVDGRSLVEVAKKGKPDTDSVFNTEDKRRHSIERIDPKEGTDLEGIVAQHLPTSMHQTDKKQFDLAGAITSPLTPKQALEVGRLWFDMADPKFLRPNLTREDYAKEFKHRFTQRKFNTGEGSEAFINALAAANEMDPPELVADNYPHSKAHQFIASLCRELARASKNGVFFISARTVMESIEAANPTKGSEILKDLRDLRLIAIHTPAKRVSRKATRYIYLGPMEEEESNPRVSHLLVTTKERSSHLGYREESLSGASGGESHQSLGIPQLL